MFGRCQEVANGIEVLPAWAHSVIGDFKARKLDSVRTEDELVRVKGDAVVSANIQPINCLPEARTEVHLLVRVQGRRA